MTKFNLDKLREIAKPRELSRAEEMALKAYPDDMGTLKKVKYISRLGFRKGYEQAQKDTIERAVKWLKQHGGYTIGIEGATIGDFRKAMEEEQ